MKRTQYKAVELRGGPEFVRRSRSGSGNRDWSGQMLKTMGWSSALSGRPKRRGSVCGIPRNFSRDVPSIFFMRWFSVMDGHRMLARHNWPADDFRIQTRQKQFQSPKTRQARGDRLSKTRRLECDIDTLSVYAVRYALGRRTYAVSDVCDVVARNMDALNDNSVTVIRRDIAQAIEDGDAGDPCDAERWRELLESMAAR